MRSSMWERIDVSSWTVREVEQAGSTPVRWLVEPGSENRWLHKDTVIPTNGIEQGEDWAEVVATQVAVALGVPCAQTALCLRAGRRGSLSLNVAPAGSSLWEGTVLLEESENIGDYFPHIEGKPGLDPMRPDVNRPGHSLLNIRSALEGFHAPPGFGGPEEAGAFDVFAGFMILDALIANRDRHEQNWAVLIPQLVTSPERLAPSYDHAGGLGYNLQDQKRSQLLESESQLQGWVSKGTAHRFEHQKGGAPTLVEHASHSLSLSSAPAAEWWRGKLGSNFLYPVLDALKNRDVPGMSDLASTFAHDMLRLNLRRLRDALK